MRTLTPEENIYDSLEITGWKNIKSPRCMKGYDCFRKGDRRAFVASFRHPDAPWNTPSHYYAAEALPEVDSFGQHRWRTSKILFVEASMPPEALTILTANH